MDRQQLPYWQERGWVRNGDTYQGTYQTPYASFLGMVEDRGYGDLRFYIWDPPPAIRGNSHWACFQERGKKGYLVHMGTRPNDVASGIMTVERLLTEALRDRRR